MEGMDVNMQEMKYIVDVIIPTYKPDKRFHKLIERLQRQSYKINKIIIVNTDEGSLDLEASGIKEAMENSVVDMEIHHIRQKDFDHGTARNLGIRYSKADIVVFMTQDAIPDNSKTIEELLRPFEDEQVYISYGRQLPMGDCEFIEAYTRQFNYPDYDIVKTKESIKEMGIKAYFSSDVCAAYRREKQIELGGFPRTIFNEDSIFAAKVIWAGGKVYYASASRVIHSHNYSYKQLFQRNFDIGVSHKDFEAVFAGVKTENEGIKLVKQTMGILLKRGKWYLIPDVILQSGSKFLGYRFGKIYKKLPKKMVLCFTSTKHYWKYR